MFHTAVQRFLAAGTILFLTLAAACSSEEQKSADLEDLVDSYLEAMSKFRPQSASGLGFHEYDGRLGARDPDSIEEWAKQIRQFLEKTEALEKNLEHPEDQFDRELLEWQLRSELLQIETLKSYEKDPLQYAFALDLSPLLMRSVPSWPERAKAIVLRLEQFPEYLAGARKTLGTPPRTATETAARSFENIAPFLRDDLPGEMKNITPELKTRFDAALPKAVSTVEETAAWLEEEVLPKTKNDYALGEDRYLAMLRTQEQFDYSVEQLLSMGREELARLQKLYKKTAAEIDPNKTPQEVTRLISEDHPSREELVSFTASELDELRRQVLEHHLVTLPEGAGSQVQAAPTFRRWNTAYIMTPGPFDPPTLKAIYFISPGEVDLTPEQVESWLRGLNQYVVRSISVHEVYPGHYVNMLHRKRSATTARKLAHSYAFTEGWAHYTEELYAEHVYGDEFPRYRLAQIRGALLRVCRYMTSIGLHTQGWSIEEGTKYFMENAYVEDVLARQQAIRGTFDPGYLFYTLGKLYIKQLRDDYQKKAGDRFNLKTFHDELLQYGNPPLPMVRARLLDAN